MPLELAEVFAKRLPTTCCSARKNIKIGTYRQRYSLLGVRSMRPDDQNQPNGLALQIPRRR
jgi:hypothetical protein